MGNTLFISDLHFGHENILSFDNRPFKDIQTHDEYIMNAWNDKVGIDDDVWIGFGVLIMSGVGIKRPKNYNDLIRIISFSVS